MLRLSLNEVLVFHSHLHLIPVRIGQIFSPEPYEYQMIIREDWFFPSVVIPLLKLFLYFPVYGASPSYDRLQDGIMIPLEDFLTSMVSMLIPWVV